MIRRDKPGPILWTFLGIVCFILIAPTLILLPMGFSSSDTFNFPPPGWSLRWYRSLFEEPAWRNSIILSFEVGIISMVLATVIGTAAAFGLMRMGVRLRMALRTSILAPLIVPQILVALAIYGVFLQLQLNGTMRALVLADTVVSLPFVVIAVLARLQSHDSRLRDAGLSLGATPRTVFFRITLPMVFPGIMAAALLAFVASFDEFIIALLLQGPSLKTLSVQMFNSIALQIDPTITAAASIIVVAVSVVILSAQLFVTRKKKVGAAK